jgi:putative DNA primase/helicase
MTFCSNFLPKAHGVDGQAFLERVILLPTNDTVPRDKRNPFLLSELALEKDGIFCWALLGLQRLQERKRFAETPSMMEAIEEAEKSSDNVRYFVDTMCELDPTGKFYTDTSDLYAVYHDFCRTNGYRYPAAVVTFSEKIQSVARYIKEKNDKYQVNGKDCKKKIMKGIKLTDDSRMRLDELRKQVGVQTTFHDMK